MSTLGAFCGSTLGAMLESPLGARTCEPCSCACGLGTCLGSQDNGSEAELKQGREAPEGDACRPENPIIIHGPDAQGTFYSNEPRNTSCRAECWRLAIYHCAHHDGARYHVNEKCRTNLRTDKRAYNGPKKLEGAYGATLLDAEPFWWPLCGNENPSGIGGWQVVGDWWVPTEANLSVIYDTILADVGAMNMPAAGQTHTLIVYTARNRIMSCCDEDSRVRLRAVHLTCPGLI